MINFNSKLKILFITLFLFLGFFCFAKISLAAIHYVSPNGSATWANSTNISTPCSVQTAFDNAVADDIVYFRGGTYQVGQSINYETPVYYPTHSGTSGHPITFKAYIGETPIINATIAPVIVSGTAGAGTTKYELHDNNVDFVALGILGGDGDLVRTTNTTKGGGWVKSVTQHILTMPGVGESHNYLDVSFGPGDTYDILHHSYDNVVSFGTQGQSYIIYDGFTFTATNNELNGVAFIYAGTGNQLLNCTFIGGSKKVCHGDNRQFILLTSQSYPKISKNKMYGLRHMNDIFGSYGQTHNTSAYKSYSIDHAEITNNEVYDCSGGFYFKTDTDDSMIAYNFVHNNGSFGISMNAYVGSQIWNNRNNSFYDNVIVNNATGNLFIFQDDTGADNDNTQIYNNTIYGGDSTIGIYFSNGETKIWNNIIQGCSAPSNGNAWTKLGEYLDNKNLTECDYNNWGTVTPGHVWTVFWYGPEWKHADSFAAWQAASVIDPSGGHPDVHGISVDPLFANGSGNLNQLYDFKLASDSPCKGAGKNGADMGANIDLVGIQSGQAPDTTPPAAPTGVVVN